MSACSVAKGSRDCVCSKACLAGPRALQLFCPTVMFARAQRPCSMQRWVLPGVARHDQQPCITQGESRSPESAVLTRARRLLPWAAMMTFLPLLTTGAMVSCQYCRQQRGQQSAEHREQGVQTESSWTVFAWQRAKALQQHRLGVFWPDMQPCRAVPSPSLRGHYPCTYFQVAQPLRLAEGRRTATEPAHTGL